MSSVDPIVADWLFFEKIFCLSKCCIINLIVYDISIKLNFGRKVRNINPKEGIEIYF